LRAHYLPLQRPAPAAMPHSENRATQRSRILAVLIEARGDWVSLPAILELGIAQYGARIFELRRLGFQIENRRQGEHSAFRLVPHPSRADLPTPAQGSFFGDTSLVQEYPD